MDYYIKNAKGKVFKLKEYLDIYIGNPYNEINLINLESFLEELGFYIKKNEMYKENSKREKLKYFLSNLTRIIQSDLEYNEKQDIINIFAIIQAEFQQPIDQKYTNVYMFDHNKRQFNPFGYFHLKLSEKINNTYKNIKINKNTKNTKNTIKKISRSINKIKSRNKSTNRNINMNKNTNISRIINRIKSTIKSKSKSKSKSKIKNKSRSRNISRSKSRKEVEVKI